LHIAAWDDAIIRRANGNAVKLSDVENFPEITNASDSAWREAVDTMKKTHERLVATVAAFPDAQLQEPVPGKSESYYNFFYMFAGIAQHELYHAGQIALLKKFK
jgi:hypothetical protein